MVNWVDFGRTPRSTPAAAPEPMQKAYVDFAMDCFRTQAEIQSNPEQPETSSMQPHSIASGTGGGPGGIAFSDSAPGGFRFLSPCRKEQRDSIIRHGEVHNSILILSVTRCLLQSLTRQLSATSIGAAAPDGLPLVSVDSLISFPASPDSPLG